MNPESTENGRGAVWGLAGTLAWGLLIGIAYMGAQLFGVGLYIGLRHADADSSAWERLFSQYEYHGLALSYGLLASAIVCLALIVVAVRLKRASLGEYLGLKAVGLAAGGYWFLVLAAFVIAFDLLLWPLGRPLVPEFSLEIYRSAAGSWLLWLAIVLVAPIAEEVFFRGFLYTGLAASAPGPFGAILITAAIWASIHLQYDLLLIASVFVIGLILGLARYRSGSLLLTIALHGLVNLGAMILTALTVAG